MYYFVKIFFNLISPIFFVSYFFRKLTIFRHPIELYFCTVENLNFINLRKNKGRKLFPLNAFLPFFLGFENTPDRCSKNCLHFKFWYYQAKWMVNVMRVYMRLCINIKMYNIYILHKYLYECDAYKILIYINQSLQLHHISCDI